MTNAKIPKPVVEKIGRLFALLFNRASMYNVDHPVTTQAITEFYKIITQGLNSLSPIVIIMAQDQFFIEEDPLDPRINTSKMLTHFKKSGLQSVSFEKGMKDKELLIFFKIFIDISKYKTADLMKTALEKQGIKTIRINHVIYKKITQDDEVIDRKKLSALSASKGGGTDQAMKSQFFNKMIENALMGDIGKNLSAQDLMKQPDQVSKALISADIAASESRQAETGSSGPLLVNQLRQIGKQVGSASSDMAGADLMKLAEAAVSMKENLLSGINAQKAAGVSYENEDQIKDETNEITDQVIIQLVKDEYKSGRITVKRLALILRRLIPEPSELQRLLPKLKKALLDKGMPLNEYLQLAQELEKELQSEGLAKSIKKSAEKIGVSGEDLIKEISTNPQQAAELIYLASEIKKGSGDDKALSEVLVDYVERVGSKIAIDTAEKKGEEGGKHLKKVISHIESQLLTRLKDKGVSSDVLNNVLNRLNDRFEESFTKLQSDWEKRLTASTDSIDNLSLLDVFQDTSETDGDFQEIINQARESAKKKNINENDFQEVINELLTSRQAIQKRKEDPGLEPDQAPVEDYKEDLQSAIETQTVKPRPEDCLNPSDTQYFIKKEISRAIRYSTTFSSAILTITSISSEDPEKPIKVNKTLRENIINTTLETLLGTLRETDIVGMLDKKNIICLLPMTEGIDSKKAMQRMLKEINQTSFEHSGIPLEIKFAGIVTVFDQYKTPNLEDYISKAKSEISDMVIRLESVQTIY